MVGKQICVVSGEDYKRMIAGAYDVFMRDYEYINSLNVFPVPDGDTGTNMLLTLTAVAKAMADCDEKTIGAVSKRAADSALMGARGNSGVILAQIFRGLSKGLRYKNCATASELAKAFQYGILHAYRAVSKPVEGTILTVAKGIAKGSRLAVRGGLAFEEVLAQAIRAGHEALEKTPEQLPALKQAGVVDAGGQGLITFLNGCLMGISGEGVYIPTYKPAASSFSIELQEELEDFDIAHPYCTEFLVKDCKMKKKEAEKILLPHGDSLVVAEGDGFLKIHLHTANPGTALQTALTWGSLSGIKIDNMAEQHTQLNEMKATKKPVALISVAAGEGISSMMKDFGALIITGGQTMNPAVEDFVNMAHKGIADKYILLPNNKNIVLAANQVKKLMGETIEVIPTTNIPQGLAAIMAFDPEKDIETNVKIMTERVQGIKTAGITNAVRDSHIDGLDVKAGQFMGLLEKGVVTVGDNLEGVLKETIAKLVDQDVEIITLYYGVDMQVEEVEALQDMLSREFNEIEFDIYFGGQALYQFIISGE